MVLKIVNLHPPTIANDVAWPQGVGTPGPELRRQPAVLQLTLWGQAGQTFPARVPQRHRDLVERLGEVGVEPRVRDQAGERRIVYEAEIDLWYKAPDRQ